ncbi:MAG TPA: hypothetical protein VE077_14225 [Candidatus Methylomirabilis sp.]|nr:hypothetical protein [Candidatus Methylomirabilis sp.]
MNADILERKRQGVPCLHCGEVIILPAEASSIVTDSHGAASAREAGFAYVVLWCTSCHKEAPYLSREFIDLGDSFAGPNPPDRAASTPHAHGLVMRRGQSA